MRPSGNKSGSSKVRDHARGLALMTTLDSLVAGDSSCNQGGFMCKVSIFEIAMIALGVISTAVAVWLIFLI